MGLLGWLSGTLGGLCMVMGIITAAEVLSPLGKEFTWLFWFALAVILFLASIAFAIGSGRGEQE